MRIVIAPDSFKESLSAEEVARAMAAGVTDAWRAGGRAAGELTIDLCPMADGGEGTVDAMVAATGGRILTADVFGPLGEKRRARFGMLGCKSAGEPSPSTHNKDSGAGNQAGEQADAGPVSAVIEMAEAAGLTLVPPEERNPLLTTTFGVGCLIRAALDAGARKLLIGIGGSATTDGGAGCAQALGIIFVGKKAVPCGLAGGGLAGLTDIDMSGRDPRIADCEILVACDVTNPLTGPNGSAAIYGPQKGATPEMVAALDAGLANLADIIRRRLGIDVERLPGAGAAGGLGAGLVAFTGAKLRRGIEIVADAVGLAGRIRGADLVITGEGKFDAQSAAGKTAVGVARVAAAEGVPVVCIPGQATPDAPHHLFAQVRPLVGAGVTVAQALAQPAQLLARRAAEAMANR
jgi:glycerate kinase